MRNLDTFKQMALESTLTQGIIAVCLVLTICYLYIAQGDAPDSLVGLLGVILGFYFRSKASNEVRANIAKNGS